MVLPKHILCIPVFIASVACFLGFFGTMCDFVRINSSAEGPNGQHSIHFGYWSYESLDNSTNTTQNVCVLYPVDHFATDTTFKVGRTFNILALILGISFIFMDILNGCASTNPRKSFRQAGGVGYFLCSLCSGLSLLIFQSGICNDNEIVKTVNQSVPDLQSTTCSLSTGGKGVIAAIVLWLIAAFGIIKMHPLHTGQRQAAGSNEP